MSDSSELDALVARARQDGPGPERLATVRTRLEARIGPLDAPRPTSSPALGATAVLGIVAIVAVLAIGAWIGVGSSAPGDTERDTANPDPGTASPAPIGPATSAPDVTSAPAPEVVPPGAAVGAQPDPAPAPASEPTTLSPPDGTERPARRLAPPASPALEPAAEDPASTLREEIALLDRALRAREAGNRAGAIVALEAHRARFPVGRLQPERDRMLAELAASEAAPPASP